MVMMTLINNDVEDDYKVQIDDDYSDNDGDDEENNEDTVVHIQKMMSEIILVII
jgi:hypothetical protein